MLPVIADCAASRAIAVDVMRPPSPATARVDDLQSAVLDLQIRESDAAN
jgi:hypothetical protein